MALQTTHKETIFHVGDIVRVYYRIIEHEKIAGKTKRSVEEKTKERIQPFEGLVTGIKGSEENKSFTVRRLSDQNIGVERVFPLVSPWIDHVEVNQRGRVRRAKLNYLRKSGNLEVKPVIEKTKSAKPSSKKQGTKRRTAGRKASSK
jgi:large subunit ribosomal protein L19